MILLHLFSTFLMIGFLSFGGGYAMIPVIEREVVRHGWMTSQAFNDGVAVAALSPGPIGTNSAIFVGHHVAGVPGAVAAAAGMVTPSLLLVLLAASLFGKLYGNPWIQSAFYGLRPVVTGLILYAAAGFALNGESSGLWTPEAFLTLVIFAGSLFALVYAKVHPVYVIVLSGLVGIALFS